MATQNYAVIDPFNKVINVVVYDAGIILPDVNPNYPDCTFVACNNPQVGSGWMYINGEFLGPPPSIEQQQQPQPQALQQSQPTPSTPSTELNLANIQEQMAKLQVQLSILTHQALLSTSKQPIQ